MPLLRGPALATGLCAFGLSAAIAVGLSLALYATGLIANVGIIVATSLGIVVVVLKDAGVLDTPLGQLTLLGGLLGDFTSVALISVIAPAGGATQLGVRLAVVAMVGFAALGQVVGLEAILGSFVAGVAVSAISDRAQGTGATG